MTQLVWIYEDPAIQYPTSRKSRKRPVRGKEQQRGMIEIVPEDILLEIFDFYRLWVMQYQGRLWRWHHLAQVCRKWRNVFSLSPHRLDLRIVCDDYGRAIEDVLYSWPTLPVVVGHRESRAEQWSDRLRQYDLYPSRAYPPRNIMVALSHPDRLCEIDLNVKSSWAVPIVKIVLKPCQALERIRITVKNTMGPSILFQNAFLGGSAPHLKVIKLDGISFPFLEIRRVLLSTDNLIELHLSKIPHAAYFSPDDLVTSLSTLVQLKSLTVDFYSPASSPPFSTTRRLPQSTSLPSLESFYFHGTSEYLDDFVSRIDLPALCSFTIRLFNQIFFDLPQFGQLIPHLKALESPTRLRITLSAELVSLFFLPEAGHPSHRICSFETSCRRLDWQLSFVTQILGHLPPLLSRVVHVTIETNQGIPTGKEDVDSTQWRELFHSFTHVKEVRVVEAELVQGVVQALVTEATATGVLLPELSDLYLHDFDIFQFVSDAAEQFIAMRSLSGRPVSLTGSRKVF